MKHIVEYKMWDKNIPYFIEDGGYFYKDGKLVGLTKDDVHCYIPKLFSTGGELVDFTRVTLKTLLDTLELKDREGNLINTETCADNFFTERGL